MGAILARCHGTGGRGGEGPGLEKAKRSANDAALASVMQEGASKMPELDLRYFVKYT
jgi:hypothetical protein